MFNKTNNSKMTDKPTSNVAKWYKCADCSSDASEEEPCSICFDDYNYNLSPHPNNSVLFIKNKQKKIILNKKYTFRKFIRNNFKSNTKIELECSHSFHYECIKFWYNACDTNNNKNASCPMCRRDILFKNKIITQILFRKKEKKTKRSNKPQYIVYINSNGIQCCCRVDYPYVKPERQRCHFISNHKHRTLSLSSG